MASGSRLVYRRCIAVLLLVSAAASAPLTGADATPVVEDKQRRLLENKLKLLDRLTTNRPAVQRIEAQDNAEAKALLRAARAAHKQASELLAAGDLEGAGRALDEGLKQIGAAARQVADQGRVKENAQRKYLQLRERILSFREAFQRVVAERGADRVAGLLDQKQINTALMDAEKLAAKGDHAQANQSLARVADSLEVALIKARHSETLIHELKFETPAEEFEYERQRNRSHVMLVDLLKRQKQLAPGALAYLEKAVTLNESVREQAEALVNSGETEAAIKKLEQGTDGLMKALRANGMGM